jgi:hypothetical protein
MKNTLLPAAISFVVGKAGGAISPPPPVSDVIALWASLERFTDRAVNLFDAAQPLTMQVAAARYLQAIIVAVAKPTAGDDE